MPLPPPPPQMPTASFPPPPPIPGSNTKHSAKVPDRNALLSQIKGGTKLKKAVTNDRSAPLIQNSKTSTCGSGPKTQGGPVGLGGVMSQGIPKLRPPGSRAGDKNTNQHPNFSHSGVNKTLNTIAHSSEVQRNRQNAISTNTLDKKSGIEHCVLSNETTAKPAPPPSKLKPSFTPNSNGNMARPAPPPSKLKPGFIPNSTGGIPSQKSFQAKNSSNPSLAPPFKSSLAAHNTAKEECLTPAFPKGWPPKQQPNAIKPDGHLLNKPLPPSKPGTTSNIGPYVSPLHGTGVTKGSGLLKPQPSVTRNHTFSASNTTEYKGAPTLSVNSSPSLPVRNNSAPDNLDQLTRHNVPRLPPPPLPPNKLIKSPSVHHKSKLQQNDHLSPSPQPNFIRTAEPPPLPKSAPPPLPHRSPQTLPRVGRSHVAPPPPARSCSKQSNQMDTREFESRFKQLFHDIQEFPYPSYKTTPHKFYMSQAYTQASDGMSFQQQTNKQLLIGM